MEDILSIFSFGILTTIITIWRAEQETTYYVLKIHDITPV